MSNSQMGSGVSKVTPQATIIINSAVDAMDVASRMRNSANTPYTDLQEDNFAVMRGELVYATRISDGKAPISRQHQGKNNPSLTVSSSLNGKQWAGQTGGKAPGQEKRASALRTLENSIYFVGVAQGEKSQRDFDNRSLSLAVRVAGSDTIFNNGHEIIHPGDDVVWSLPTPGKQYSCRHGQPKTKKSLVVGKYSYGDSQLAADLRDCLDTTNALSSDEKYVHDAIKQFAVNLPEKRENFMKVLSDGTTVENALYKSFVSLLKHVIHYKHVRYDSRVIGKCLSQGDPGHSFDILLNHTHSTA
jgi:hypothetical protein